MTMLEDLKLEDITYQKTLLIIINVIINGNVFNDQATDSDIKQYEKIRILSTGQDEDYTTVFLLDYEYINNDYRLIAVDLSRQKELDANPKAIQ